MKRFLNSQEKHWESGTAAEKEAAMKAGVEFGAAMGRATPFLFSLRPENKLRYDGAGVKLDSPDRPILWFSPRGDAQYQVVYADLSVKEVAESALPPLPAVPQPKSAEPMRIVGTSPRVTLPQSAVKNYDALQAIRKAGKQDEVRFLEVQWMQPFMENDADPVSKIDPESSRFSFLTEFRNLEGLIVDNLSLTEKDLDVIGRCQNLKKLSLSGIEIVGAAGKKHRLKGADLRHLSQLTKLEMLDLSQSDFPGGLQHLAELPKLQSLIFTSFENLNDPSIAELKQLPHLETLVLAAVYANDPKVNPKITVTDEGLDSLKELPSLRTLYVEWHGDWTMPVEKLQALRPGVDVQRGWVEEPANRPGLPPLPVPPLPHAIELRKE